MRQNQAYYMIKVRLNIPLPNSDRTRSYGRIRLIDRNCGQSDFQFVLSGDNSGRVCTCVHYSNTRLRHIAARTGVQADASTLFYV
jgi:hypothetical protein